MKKIKPLRKKHRFIRWLKRLLRIQSPSEAWIKGTQGVDEMHEWKEELNDAT